MNTRIITALRRIADLLLSPIRRNGAFFVSMYVLGILCGGILTTNPKWVATRFYANTPWELFADLYLLCALLALMPRKLRLGLRGVLYVVLYGLALVDVYCYQAFGSTITPSMLMLVGETDSREAS